jgi:hypothetical protein
MRKNGRDLRDVKEQTPEMCLEAVRNDPWALEFVKEQTEEICPAALKREREISEIIEKHTP